MKHNIKLTLILVAVFILAQFTGLYIINHYIDRKATVETSAVQWRDLPLDIERPRVENQSTSFIYLLIAIFIGTLLFFVILKYKKPFLLRAWFFLTIFVTLTIAFGAFIKPYLAAALSLGLALMRMFRPNVIVHNLTEIFIYGGLAAIFVPILNVFAVFMLLILISIYDIIAVWKTKHMVKLAEFQAESKVFAGLFISNKIEKVESNKKSSSAQKSEKFISKLKPSAAILGGGDIGFPLMFAGTVMKEAMLIEPVAIGFAKASIISFCAALALLGLLLKGSKNKYYPAMPFISLGCFVGYLVVSLL